MDETQAHPQTATAAAGTSVQAARRPLWAACEVRADLAGAGGGRDTVDPEGLRRQRGLGSSRLPQGCASRAQRPAQSGACTMAAMPETRFTRAGDVDIAYQVVGDAAPLDLVVVPGWVSHLEVMWELPEFAHFLDRLAGMGRLILFDKRGTEIGRASC